MQRLLRTADWDVDGVRDDLRGYVLERLGDGAGVWIVDDTGFHQEGCAFGRGAAPVHRHQREDRQLSARGVFGLRQRRGRALVDRELYLPTSWTEATDRCAVAGIPKTSGSRPSRSSGVAMLARAHDAGVLEGWVTADEAFGQNRAFRGWLAARAVPFVVVTRSDDTLTCPMGTAIRPRTSMSLAALHPRHFNNRSG